MVLQTTRKMDIQAQVCNDTDVKIVIVHGLKIMEIVFPIFFIAVEPQCRQQSIVYVGLSESGKAVRIVALVAVGKDNGCLSIGCNIGSSDFNRSYRTCFCVSVRLFISLR